MACTATAPNRPDERNPIYRFCVMDFKHSKMPFGCDLPGLGRRGTLAFTLVPCTTDEHLQATSEFVYADGECLLEADFIVVDKRDSQIRVECSGVYGCRVAVRNDPNQDYVVTGYEIDTLCGDRAAIRDFLLDSRHVCVVFNPLLPWYRRMWLQHYFWLRDFPSTN